MVGKVPHLIGYSFSGPKALGMPSLEDDYIIASSLTRRLLRGVSGDMSRVPGGPLSMYIREPAEGHPPSDLSTYCLHSSTLN